jgi:hypothetical protein
VDAFVPRDFDVPRRLETPQFVLQPLGPEHNDKDLYTVLDPASRDVIGCVYIYPRPGSDYDARALSWVRASHAQLDTPLWRAVSEWLASDWPFSSIEYAPRAQAP